VSDSPAAARLQGPQAGLDPGLQRRHGTNVAALLERQPAWARDFHDLSNEWRRLFAELVGTFFLVLVGAGGAVLEAQTGMIGRSAGVVAPGLLVMAMILAIGAVSGAHLNPVVSVAFALRRDFQWRRLPGYVTAQLAGALLACLMLRATFGTVGELGATLPRPGFTDLQGFVIETVLTFGLVTTILGTASTAQNVGPLAAFGVGGYIVLAGLWSSPVSGASMNPARSLGPDLVRGSFSGLWPYLAGPLLGALLAVAAAYVLRGPGGDPAALKAAGGT